jgi:hypothetical protein
LGCQLRSRKRPRNGTCYCAEKIEADTSFQNSPPADRCWLLEQPGKSSDWMRQPRQTIHVGSNQLECTLFIALFEKWPVKRPALKMKL